VPIHLTLIVVACNVLNWYGVGGICLFDILLLLEGILSLNLIFVGPCLKSRILRIEPTGYKEVSKMSLIGKRSVLIWRFASF
jgi:hypothetical protein